MAEKKREFQILDCTREKPLRGDPPNNVGKDKPVIGYRHEAAVPDEHGIKRCPYCGKEWP